MFRSLRFRLPAFFLAGVVLAGHRLDGDRDPALPGLHPLAVARRAAARGAGAHAALRAAGDPLERRGPLGADFDRRQLEQCDGDRLFYVGARRSSPGHGVRPAEQLPQSVVEAASGRSAPRGQVVTFEFTPPGEKRTFLAVGEPLHLGRQPDLRRDDRREEEDGAHERLALARRAAPRRARRRADRGRCLAWYLSRRITRPVLALSDAADQVAEGPTTTSTCPRCAAAVRSATSPSASGRWRRG